MDGNMMAGQRPRRVKWLAVVLIVAGLAIAAAGVLKWKLSEKFATKSEYQAVFLTNGQVYFGKLELEHRWAKLTDIYYLQLSENENLQPAGAGNQNTQTTGTGSGDQQQKIQLVKLGSELHGPQDEMYLEKDSILFWENMKDDSKVLQSIKQYQGK